MNGEATILHADLDAFYASVEQRDQPHLRGRPLIVGGGVVLACSYEAKRRGVRTAMNGRQARALCPEAIVVPPRMRAYADASRAVFAVFRDTTPIVEGLSIDEAFLEVGGLRGIAGPPTTIAQALRERVAREVGLPITVGIARTKFLAKVASGVAKPDGLLLVPPDREREFLHPLPVERLWGVGRVTSAKLHALGVRTVADAAALGEAGLVSVVGRAAGRHLNALSIGLDPRRVDTARRRRSIGSQQALGRRPRGHGELDAILAGTLDRLGRRLRSAHLTSRTVVLRLRFGDFSRATRSRSLAEATAHTDTLLVAARVLLRATLPMIDEQGITLLGVSLAGLEDDRHTQLALPFDVRAGSAIDSALDAVQARFGARSVTRATQLRLRPALEFPLLDD
ncbi:MAG TPA: DNA polymerase IV [Pseudonocardia sp.]